MQLVVGGGVVGQVCTAAHAVAAPVHWLKLQVRHSAEACGSRPCYAGADTLRPRPHLTPAAAMVLYALAVRHIPAFCLAQIDALHRHKEREVAV